MGGIKIVEYDHSYAKAVADMWNKSSDSWGGSNVVRTEESVVQEHVNSFNLTVFLAVDGDEVVGYCSFSKYAYDEGALYIPLLNVRPDYHGKKVGKTLVKRAVEKTIEMGWPRLDLFTWPGNTKAVPVYKKCGFFWEKRDDATHLMNFIPTVIGTEALSEYFEKTDWYEDSRRVIEIKPDGIEENGFTVFEYRWEKDGKALRVQFEKTGRGMTLIETDDYLINTKIEAHELVFGRDYRVIYQVVNKSGKPLNVEVRGKDNKNIRFGMEKQTLNVSGSAVIEGSFRVEEVAEETSIWNTHPAVAADILINGKKAEFRMGIAPKFPAKLTLSVPFAECYKDRTCRCWLELVNNFREPAVFEFELPCTGDISFENGKLSVEAAAKERKLIAVDYRLKNYNGYNQEVGVKAMLANGEAVRFKKQLYGVFRGNTGMYGGEDDYAWYLVNGGCTTRLIKRNNSLLTFTHVKDQQSTGYEPPKLGKPFSSEFFRKKPCYVEYSQEADAMVQRALYQSDEFKGIELVSIVRLYQNGIVERYYEVSNKSSRTLEEDLWLADTIYHSFFRAVIPYEDRIIELRDSFEFSAAFWDDGKITENWIFSKGDRLTRGICWPEEYRMKLSHNAIFFEHNLGKLSPGEKACTKPICVAFGTYAGWEDFRAFALGDQFTGYRNTTDSLELKVNGGNPFVRDRLLVEAVEHKNTYFDGSISLSSAGNRFERQTKYFTLGEGVLSHAFEAEPQSREGMDVLKMDFDFETQAFSKKTAVFYKGGGDVKTGRISEYGFEGCYADNGVIVIKASADFSYALYSMKYKGREWLDTNFPAAGPKSWWNPWVGGIGCKPWGMMNVSAQQELRSMAEAKLQDSCGNMWKGIRLGMKVEKHENLRGLEYNQYFMLLPGIPVMCHTAEVLQNTGSFLNPMGLEVESFLKPDGDILKSWFVSANREGEMRKYKSGRIAYNIGSDSSLIFGSENCADCLQIFVNRDRAGLMGFSNRNDTAAMISIRKMAAHGEKFFTAPVFYIFTDSFIEDRLLNDLKNISF